MLRKIRIQGVLYLTALPGGAFLSPGLGVLQLPVLRCGGLQRRLQLARGGLGFPLLRPGQLGRQLPEHIPDFLQQRAVLPVLCNKAIQHPAIVHQQPGVVRRHLVHGAFVIQLHPLSAIAVHPCLHQLLLSLEHRIPERPVFPGRQLLQPVGKLVAKQKANRIGVVALHQHLAAPDLRVGLARCHAVHKAHPHPQRLCRLVQGFRRLRCQVCPRLPVAVQLLSAACNGLLHKRVIYQAAFLSRRGGKPRRLPLLRQGSRRVVLPGGVGGKPLRLRQHIGRIAAHLLRLCPRQSRLVVLGKAPVVVAGAHLAPGLPIGRPQRPCAVLPKGLSRVLQQQPVIYLPRRRPPRLCLDTTRRLCYSCGDRNSCAFGICRLVIGRIRRGTRIGGARGSCHFVIIALFHIGGHNKKCLCLCIWSCYNSVVCSIDRLGKHNGLRLPGFAVGLHCCVCPRTPTMNHRIVMIQHILQTTNII